MKRWNVRTCKRVNVPTSEEPMMHQEIIFSGFGGQGALFAGQLLAYAALDSGLQVT